MLKFSGKITAKTETQTGTSAKGDWSKCTIVVDGVNQTDEGKEYEFTVAVDLFNRDVEKFSIGQTVTLNTRIVSREYNGKWYTNCSLIFGTIDVDVKDTPAVASESPFVNATSEPDDDLPF